MAAVDLRFWDGSEWVSVGDVAADKVTLPVPSADGTVVLDSPEAGTFSIETGGVERLRVQTDGNVLMPLTSGIYFWKDTFGIGTRFSGGTELYSDNFIKLGRIVGGAYEETVRCDTANRNFGIRLNSPNYPLHVNGDCYIQSGQHLADPTVSTASKPSFAYHTDEDTGTFRPGSNTWAVSTGGEERLRVRADGNVGIGSAGHARVRLAVEGATDEYGVFCNPTFSAGADVKSCRFQANIPAGSTVTQITYSDIYGAAAGAGASVGTAIGLYVRGTAAVGTTNYGCLLRIPAGTSNFNVYADSDAPNYFKGQIRTGPGTAAAPAVSIFGDEDTGTFSPAAGNWAVSTNGTERLRVRSDGNVGIGGSGGGTSKVAVQGLLSGTGAIFGLNNIMQGQCDGGIIYAYAATPSITGTPANVFCYGVGNIGSTAANAERIVGFRVDATEWSATATDGNYGFWSTIDSESGKTNYSIFANGTAPNLFAGQVQTGIGTAAAPSVSISGDEDTGTFSPAANTWAVSTGGVERLRADNFGIDVKAPAASNSITRIRMRGSDSKDYLNFTSYTDGYTAGKPLGMAAPCSYIGPSNGQLGIGAPTEIRFGIDSTAEVIMSATGTVFLSPCMFGASGGTSAANPAIHFAGSSTSGFYAPAADTIAVSTGGVERLRVDAEGRVGIGVNPSSFNPAFDDLVVGNGTGDHGITVFGAATGTIAFADASGGSGAYSGYVQYIHSSDKLVFGTGSTARLWLDSTGRLGVGVSSPSSRLDVGGQVTAEPSSAAAVSYGFHGDTDTGTFSPAADTWALSTGGLERLRVDGNGDLLAATGYTPATAQSLATKAYVDANSAASTTTRSVQLTNPTQAAGRLTPPAGLKTQEDANFFFGDELAKRSPVVVCTQVEYDGITPDPETLYIING